MARITPIPTTRVSDAFAAQRLRTQLQYDQVSLLNLQQQISTGRRIGAPSEDAPAALRAITLQRILEQKAQVKTNLATNQSFLGATDSSLSQIASLLNETRGAAQAVAATTSTNEQREAAATQIDRALQQLVDAGNQKFRDRYLFAGSRTSELPFEVVGNYVRYNGNETDLLSYSDLDILFETNFNGSQVFGAISDPVRGTADLNPALSEKTKLADLNGGIGLKLGSIEISDGVNSQVVDLSSAETLGDVRQLLEANPPLGRVVTVGFDEKSLAISLDSLGGGNLFISEVGGGNTARGLGVANNQALGTGPIVGADLNPAVKPTTAIRDLFGTFAGGTILGTGDDNDLTITAKARGAATNGYSVNFVSSGTVIAGGETVAFDALTNTFTVDIQNGGTTAAQVATALNGDPAFSARFSVAPTTTDGLSPGSGLIDLSSSATTAGGTGTEFDQSSGLQIQNGGKTTVIDISQAKTVEDLLNTLNGSGANILASINADGTGINIRSRLSGSDFSIGENGGTTATQLGLRTFLPTKQLSELNHGLGVHTNAQGPEFEINRADGTVLIIDLDDAQTVQDVLDKINNHPANQDPTSRVTARLAAFGNGIELVDNGTGGTFSIERKNNSVAADDLGLLSVGVDRLEATTSGGTQTITGRDVLPAETDSVFNALIRLRDALRSNDQIGLERSLELVDSGTKRVTYSRAELGARQQALDVLQTRIEDEDTVLQGSLSDEIDTDITSAISNLVQRQAALQASLQLAAQTSKLTLLDYL